MGESRKVPRRRVLQGAWIFLGGGATSIPCVIVDLSDAGARLKVDPEHKLPEQFILVMSRDGLLNRRCRTVWRQEDQLGVNFVSQTSLRPKAQRPVRRFGVPVPDGFWQELQTMTEQADEQPPSEPDEPPKEPASG